MIRTKKVLVLYYPPGESLQDNNTYKNNNDVSVEMLQHITDRLNNSEVDFTSISLPNDCGWELTSIEVDIKEEDEDVQNIRESD